MCCRGCEASRVHAEILMVHRLSKLDKDGMYVKEQVNIFELNFDEYVKKTLFIFEYFTAHLLRR